MPNSHFSQHDYKKIAVVIATHKRYPALRRCLESFVGTLENPIDFIFVDNGSDEDLTHWARELFPQLTVLKLPANRLFCGGYNAGIRKAMERGYEFILICNADTEVVNTGFLGELVEVAERWPKAAFVGPLVFHRSIGVVQKTCLRFPNVMASAAVWLPWRLLRGFCERQPSEESVVDFLNGVCVLCRVKALHEIGLMDETMGGYVEDADWAWRAKAKGWVSVFAPVPSVIHHEQEDGYEFYSLKTFLLKRNTVFWFLKTGQTLSARMYVFASLLLTRARMQFESCGSKKAQHLYFFNRLKRVYSGLLRGEVLGSWFGPPLGPWEGIEM